VTDDQSADQTIAGILGPTQTERECELAVRVTLLENYAFNLQEANDRLAQHLREVLDQIKTLKGML
jgi:hypothetical protein